MRLLYIKFLLLISRYSGLNLMYISYICHNSYCYVWSRFIMILHNIVFHQSEELYSIYNAFLWLNVVVNQCFIQTALGGGGIFPPPKKNFKFPQNSADNNVVFRCNGAPLPLNLKFPPKVKGSGWNTGSQYRYIYHLASCTQKFRHHIGSGIPSG